MTGSKSLGDTGFLQFLGLFQVIMANPAVLKIQYFNGKLEVFFSWQNGSPNRFFMIKDQWNYTPAKTNIDTKNQGLEKVTPFKNRNSWYLC